MLKHYNVTVFASGHHAHVDQNFANDNSNNTNRKAKETPSRCVIKRMKQIWGNANVHLNTKYNVKRTKLVFTQQETIQWRFPAMTNRTKPVPSLNSRIWLRKIRANSKSRRPDELLRAVPHSPLRIQNMTSRVSVHVQPSRPVLPCKSALVLSACRCWRRNPEKNRRWEWDHRIPRGSRSNLSWENKLWSLSDPCQDINAFTSVFICMFWAYGLRFWRFHVLQQNHDCLLDLSENLRAKLKTVHFPKVMEFSLQIYFLTASVVCVKVRLLERIYQMCLIKLPQSSCAHLMFPQVYSEVLQSAKHPGSQDCLRTLSVGRPCWSRLD